MQLAKSVIDVGLSTNNLEPMLRFWQQDVAVRFDHVLPVRRGQKQYRHDEQGSVIKLNHHAEPLPEAAPSGYRELIIAREGLQEPRRMVDPDGNCQSAFKFDPVSASNFDPFERRVLTVALASSELAGVAETWRARAA